MNLIKKRILITAGEPASISSEITIKAIKKLKKESNSELILITDPSLIKYELKNLNQLAELNILDKKLNFKDYKKDFINIIPIKLNEITIPGILNKKNSDFVLKSIKKSVDFLLQKKANAVVTNPINKFIMKSSNFKFNGHTEYLGHLSKFNKKPIMMLESEKLRVVPLTTHIPISSVSKKINTKMIIEKINILNNELINIYKIKNPKIYISGLNPHSGDGGKIGKEELTLIYPAIRKLKKLGLNVKGPFPGDTLFQKHKIKEYDVAVCMYHDQALIPIKTLYSGNIINTTLGLDFIRTSPDHGTALDIAGMKKANPNSLILAIKKAEDLIHKKYVK
ncbi:MAG: 4-hydroxythreonine-4-phosphate dehydrogenase PdxA [Alphaproteobacteria bacterium]|nr:MAG: 4-hydroxythreonine-4-phosphate dehydrogenase PdxA [Alphaproteobacteria bacterium]